MLTLSHELKSPAPFLAVSQIISAGVVGERAGSDGALRPEQALPPGPALARRVLILVGSRDTDIDHDASGAS